MEHEWLVKGGSIAIQQFMKNGDMSYFYAAFVMNNISRTHLFASQFVIPP